jgi:phosphopantothenoylcysteine decarboxylase/phosphopantothenate--cysteine ligase
MSTGSTDSTLKVLLGVTGGIAAYKSPELVRRLKDSGADVRVVMTRAAQHFVGPTTFQAVSGHRVRTDLWDVEAEASMGHIELARWSDLVLVAPATANFIAAYAGGFAGDLLTTLCLATRAPVLLAPAMNNAMWAHAAVEANCASLQSRGVCLLGPASGKQACGETGLGRMLEPEEIVAAVLSSPSRLNTRSLGGLRVVVSAGPTREPIDPVRYISNRSSGKMGFAIAAAAQAAGADVRLVSGPVNLPTPAGVRRIDVETAEQMYQAVHSEVGSANIFIGCAAISDYRPEEMAAQKIKRTSHEYRLNLVRSLDTLASVAALQGGPFTVGFAAETCDVATHAREKLERKRVDMIAANRVGPACGFDKETNALEIFWSDESATIGEDTKTNVAHHLIEIVAERYRATRTSNASARPTAVGQ